MQPRSSVPPGCLSVALLFVLLFVFPFFFVDAFFGALAKLGLTPGTSFLVVLGIFAGGLINIPVKRIPRDDTLEIVPLGLFGFDRVLPRLVQRRAYTIIAVNVGGCIVPCLVAAYEMLRVWTVSGAALAILIAAVAANSAICYRVARPVPNLGIALPPLVPAAVATAAGLLFVPALAPPIAFTVGVLGPLIGADLLHLKDIGRIGTGAASIGGAGTFDGIVLSGLIATLLA
jgi:uncharacterized membrane protein